MYVEIIRKTEGTINIDKCFVELLRIHLRENQVYRKLEYLYIIVVSSYSSIKLHLLHLFPYYLAKICAKLC